MTTVSRLIPQQPHIEVPKKQAQELLKQSKQQLPDALDRIRRHHQRFSLSDDSAISIQLKLSDAQLVIAREYGFGSWPQLKRRILDNKPAQLIDRRFAIRMQWQSGIYLQLIRKCWIFL